MAWQSATLESNGLRLHYTRTGGDKPALVMSHGFSDDGLCWTPVAELLAPEYDIVMVDARGHGRSAAPEKGYGSAEHVADLAGVIDGLRLHRPILLGHSMGAMTTLLFAGTHSDIARAILLEDPPPVWSPAWPPTDRPRRAPSNWIIDIKRKTREEMIADQHDAAPSWSDSELGPWADSKLRLSLNVLNQEGQVPVDWSSAVSHITCPVLLITADRERGAIVSPEDAAALQAALPQMKVARITGAGHNIRREQFESYMKVVRAFLKDLGE
ncbi:MAG TPA: alpha/beta hydrolase [Anaerolineae bacterium]|jgi:pimeloyl-ACP methyl ester carboxylesterase